VQRSFWNRPLPPLARHSLVGAFVLAIAIGGVAVGFWVHFNHTYDAWLAEPQSRLSQQSHLLIHRGGRLELKDVDDLARVMDEHLLRWSADRNVMELSRSDLLVFGLRGVAFAKVYLQTRLQDGSGERRTAFVCEMRRENGQWRWTANRDQVLE